MRQTGRIERSIRKVKIYLSPSDQSDNITAIGTTEAEQCGKIARECAKILNARGNLTLVGDNTQKGSYRYRVKESNLFGADLHICIHTNAGGGQGTLVLCSNKSKENAYVKSVYEKVAELTPTKDKGIQVRTDLYEINATKAVCIYIEVEFHDNIDSEKWIDKHIVQIAKAIADGITPEGEHVLYKVQVGAFSIKDNAVELQNQLKKLGYDAIIKEERT